MPTEPRSADEPTREKGVREASKELVSSVSELKAAIQELASEMEDVLIPSNTGSPCEDDDEPKREECGWARDIRKQCSEVTCCTELVRDLQSRLDA